LRNKNQSFFDLNYDRMNHKINMFGNGYKFYFLEFTDVVFNRIDKLRNNVPWEILFGEPGFKEYLLTFNVSNKINLSGLEIGIDNTIEIKQANTKLTNFKSINLTKSTTFFPLFQTEIKNCFHNILGNKQIVFVEKEIGLIQSFEIKTDRFIIDNLYFQVYKYKNLEICSGITYDKRKVPLVNSDSLISKIIVYA